MAPVPATVPDGVTLALPGAQAEGRGNPHHPNLQSDVSPLMPPLST